MLLMQPLNLKYKYITNEVWEILLMQLCARQLILCNNEIPQKNNVLFIIGAEFRIQY